MTENFTSPEVQQYEHEEQEKVLRQSMAGIVAVDGWAYKSQLDDHVNQPYTAGYAEMVQGFRALLQAMPEAEKETMKARLKLEIYTNRLAVLDEVYEDIVEARKYEAVTAFLDRIGYSRSQIENGTFEDSNGYYEAITVRRGQEGYEVMVPESWRQSENAIQQPTSSENTIQQGVAKALNGTPELHPLIDEASFRSVADMVRQFQTKAKLSPEQEKRCEAYLSKRDRLISEASDAESTFSRLVEED